MGLNDINKAIDQIGQMQFNPETAIVPLSDAVEIGYTDFEYLGGGTVLINLKEGPQQPRTGEYLLPNMKP